MQPHGLIDKLLRGGRSVAFLYYGLTKLGGTEATRALYDAIGFGQFPRYITGSAETLGALALWVPGLQSFGGAILALTMCVALFAMTVFVGGPWWHLALLLLLSLAVVLIWRRQLRARLRRV